MMNSFRGSNRLFAILLVALALLFIFVVTIAVRKFNRDVSLREPDVMKTTEAKGVPNGMSAQAQTPTISGFVSEVLTKEGSPEKWIKLVAQEGEGDSMKSVTYLFYLGKDTKGMDLVRSGVMATISSPIPPSEKEYVGAALVVLPQQEK